ncbi:conserved hypothetical protein [Paecilomyces variotii No. 5]|uniref:Cytochrome c oxidase assembly protein COX20, mitochondrial n=1 Tax=Byssochlamys spectabilis (strain No. 5 / NBRC 109023) TaxID=1356009 RepID=V5FGL3_BYSSN|nr:conserved hypothetical protein [Paecilomyces variotii No. 5]
MAGDTRESGPSPTGQQINDQTTSHTPPSATAKPKHELPKSQVGKLWDAFGNPEEPINMAPGAYSNTGGKAKDISVSDAVKSISLNEMSAFYKTPCSRDSLLIGLGAGFGVGGIRGVVGGLKSIWPACNWAVGSFAVISIAAYELCQRQRVKEIDGMKQAVEMMKELKLKKQREKEQKQAEEAARLEEERRRKSWTNLSNYKFW